MSRIVSEKSIKQSPIRKIMEMTDKKNIIKLGLNPDDIISFAGGWVNHEAPEELREEYIRISNDKNLFHNIGGYSSTEGDAELRLMLSRMDKELYGTSNLTEDNIIIGQSSTQILFGVFLTLLNPEDKVLLFDPTYANYPEQIHVLQRKENIVDLTVFDKKSWSFMRDENAILSSLEETIKKDKPRAILVSSPDNPTGQILSDEFVEEMLDIALRFEVFVLIDQAYRAQYFTKYQPKQFSFSPENYENLVKIHSNSKWCRGLGRRLGWAEANKNIIDSMKTIQQTIILCPDTMHQVAMANYIKHSLEDGSLKRYFEYNRKKYENAAEFTSKCIDKYLGMRYLKPQGGLYTVIDVEINGDKFVQDVLKSTGVVFVSGRGFGKSLENGIRMSFGPLVNNLNKIEEGFSRVQKFINGD